jgi:hypothetical protein
LSIFTSFFYFQFLLVVLKPLEKKQEKDGKNKYRDNPAISGKLLSLLCLAQATVV